MAEIPGPDLDKFYSCSFVCYAEDGSEHPCGNRAVAVFDGPIGRLPRCKRHERGVRSREDYRQIEATPWQVLR